MNVLSLFDGISCGQVALQRMGIKVDNYFASEIDKYAIQITQKNYPNTIQLGDVYNIDYSKLPKIDIIIGGSPCTHWSIAKNDRQVTNEGIGFELFMQYVKAVKICKPKYFIYENNHSIHKNIKMSISEKLGVEFIMIDSALLSAQRRQRCYWTNIPNIIQPINKNILLKDILEENIKGYNYNINSTVIWSKYNQSISKDKSYTLETSSQNLSSIMDQTVITPIREGYFNKGGQGNRIYSIKGKSVCLMTRKSGMGIYKVDLPNGDYDIRKLTPIQVQRLQTLPDNYTLVLDENGKQIISNTQRYKGVGNGWTVDVICHILSFIKE